MASVETSPADQDREPLEQTPENVDRIVEATIDVIASEGVHKTRLKDVSQVAGVSIGTIQYYFNTRDNLIDKALYRYTSESVDYLRHSVGPDDDPWEAIVTILHAHLDREDAERKARIWLSLVHESMHEIRYLRMLNTISEEWRKFFRDLMIRGVVTGRFIPTTDLDDVVELISGLTDAFAVSQVSAVADYGKRLHRVLDIFIGSLHTTLGVQDR